MFTFTRVVWPILNKMLQTPTGQATSQERGTVLTFHVEHPRVEWL